jgi:hypothetical protein
LDTLCCVRSSRWSGERVGDGVRRPARVGARDLVARQRGCVARPRAMHNCFAKGAVSGLRNHVAHRSGMIVSFGVAEDAAAQKKVDFRFGSLGGICSAKEHVRFTPESGHWVPFANVLAPYSRLAARPSSSGPTYFARLLIEREIAR